MADRITLGLKTAKWTRLLRDLKQSAVGERGVVMATLVTVANRDALPLVRRLTPRRTGKLQSGWKVGRRNFRGRQLSVEIENRDPRARFFEWGTLSRRKRATSKGTLKRRAQKAAKGKDFSGRSGGIRPRAMTRVTIRTLRVQGTVIRELARQHAQAVRQLARGLRG